MVDWEVSSRPITQWYGTAAVPPCPRPCLCHPSLGSPSTRVLLFPRERSPSGQIPRSRQPAARPCAAEFCLAAKPTVGTWGDPDFRQDQRGAGGQRELMPREAGAIGGGKKEGDVPALPDGDGMGGNG